MGKPEYGHIFDYGSASKFAVESTWGSGPMPKGWIPVSVIFDIGNPNCGILFADRMIHPQNWIIGFNGAIRSIAPKDAEQIVLATEMRA